MTDEKMQEDYNTWYAKKIGVLGTRQHKEWFAPWSASRAAIEVELPDDGADDARDAGLSAETFDHGYCFALDRMVTILESLGLKVKP